MSLVARVDNVTKSYRLGSERSNWRALIPGPRGEHRSGDWFDALHEVSLDVAAGEAIGIIGQNGAGKSTLLKVLAGIVRPTTGTVEVRGRAASVIELGVGFNPELTGSENLRFAGALLGVRPTEVERHHDEIVDFSGLAAFMDTPVKRYSTGMRARLGFALVTSFDADLVILDEVLSVGDWAFQQKCLERVRALHRAGAAVVAVSHNNWLITQLCDHAILLEEGRIVESGDPLSVIERYLGEDTVTDPDKDERFPSLGAHVPVGDDSPVRITDLVVEPAEIRAHERLRFRFVVEVEREVEGQLAMSMYTMGRAVFAEPSIGPDEPFARPGRWEVSGTTDPLPFSPGGFKLRVVATPRLDPEDPLQEHVGAYATATVPFRVLGDIGVRPGLQWHTDWDVTELPTERPDPAVVADQPGGE